MSENDHDLKAALRRVDPPAGFEQRVLARLDGAPRQQEVRRFTAWAAAAAMACASITGVAIYQHERQQRAMQARDQLIQALQITGKTLDSVREQINRPEQHNEDKSR